MYLIGDQLDPINNILKFLDDKHIIDMKDPKAFDLTITLLSGCWL